MKIVVAPDSFKDSLSALQAANAIEAGIHVALPGAQVVKVPVADGGEGTMETLVEALGGEYGLSRNLVGINLLESKSIPTFVVWKTIV